MDDTVSATVERLKTEASRWGGNLLSRWLRTGQG